MGSFIISACEQTVGVRARQLDRGGYDTNTCSVSAPFTCTEVRVVSGRARDTITIRANEISGIPTFSGATGTCGTPTAGLQFHGNGQNIMVLRDCPNGRSGDMFEGSFDITYTLTGSRVSHTTTLQYSGIME